jgi:predicted aldo/keto reductase-like oxidoreductase
MTEDFLHRDVPAFGNRMFRLGLSTTFGIDGEDLEWALEQGFNYVFWTPKSRRVTKSLKAALKRDRESIILACGPTTGYYGGGIRRACERLLKKLDTDYLDVFQLFWLGRASAWRPSTIDALVSLRESGKVRAIGTSIHDRIKAGNLAEDSPLDMLMIRYNAAHRGAEQDIFPHLDKREEPSPQGGASSMKKPCHSSPYTASGILAFSRKPAIVAYTATRWRALLNRPKGWTGPVMTAGDCYRFCLDNPHVDLVLTGPKNRLQLEENLRCLKENGPLSEEEKRWISDFGQMVHQASSRFTFRF